MTVFELNFHYGKNYGAFLQAFALQSKVEAKIINFEPGYPYFVGARGKKFPIVWRILGVIRYVTCVYFIKFPEYLKLNRTTRFSDWRSVYKLKLPKSLVFITGSDQVWNPKFILERERFYFLDFAPEGARRISYAASLGVKSWPKPFERRVLPMLQKFDAISVREESSVPYLTSLGLKNVVCVCDPTILHAGDFYRKEFPYERCEGDFTFVYRIREEIPETVRSAFRPGVKEVHLQKRRTIVSVTEWLRNIDCANFVVTDSFHCAVFCILFHKPFLVIPNRSTGKGMNERFSTLLGKTGLEYRVLTCEESRDEVLKKLNAPVDWEKVDAILEEWRAYSANWLKNALGE